MIIELLMLQYQENSLPENSNQSKSPWWIPRGKFPPGKFHSGIFPTIFLNISTSVFVFLFLFFLQLRETHTALPFPVFFLFFFLFSFFCQPCLEYQNQSFRMLGLFIRRKTAFVATQLSHSSENGFCHFKEQLRCPARVVLRNSLFVILFSADQKLQKLSILLITNYSSVYLSIYLFYLSIYITVLLVAEVSYQKVPYLPENYS